jgi:hypothetical protein
MIAAKNTQTGIARSRVSQVRFFMIAGIISFWQLIASSKKKI